MSAFEKPKRVEKPWGHELWWAHTDRYVGKLLHVKAGNQLSLQYHVKKDETIHLWSGEMVLVLKDGDRLIDHAMKPGDSYHVKPGHGSPDARRHRLSTCSRSRRPRSRTSSACRTTTDGEWRHSPAGS